MNASNGVGMFPSPVTPGQEAGLAASTRLCPLECVWPCARCASHRWLYLCCNEGVWSSGCSLSRELQLRRGVYGAAAVPDGEVRVHCDCLQAGVTGDSC